jgi:hypothetical protein
MSTRFEGPLKNPNLSDEENSRVDTLMDTGGMTTGEAWRNAPVISPNPKPEEIDEKATLAAAQRVVGNIEPEDDLPTAAPPKPGEPDESIRRRHREALKARDSASPGYDPKVSAAYLERLTKGEFTDPPEIK